MAKKKFYAVKTGRKIGIFETWDECQDSTKGFPKAEFKSFTTIDEAKAYLNDIDIWTKQINEDIKNNYLVAFTDGSFDDDTGIYSYGAIYVYDNGVTAEGYGYGDNLLYANSRNVAGELFAAIDAFETAMRGYHKKLKIYHDYEGVAKWITGEWKLKTDIAKYYVDLYNHKFKDKVHVEFVKVPAHSNVLYNEKADKLAKLALLEYKKLVLCKQ